MKANEVFEGIKAKLEDYGRACEEFEATKERMRKELGDGFWDWYQTHDKPECPITDGQAKAYRLWYWNDREEMNMDDFLWEREVKDFIDTLRAAGVETFTYTNASTALMENMHWFQREGCTLLGLCEVESDDKWEQTKLGVRFAL